MAPRIPWLGVDHEYEAIVGIECPKSQRQRLDDTTALHQACREAAAGDERVRPDIHLVAARPGPESSTGRRYSVGAKRLNVCSETWTSTCVAAPLFVSSTWRGAQRWTGANGRRGRTASETLCAALTPGSKPSAATRAARARCRNEGGKEPS